MIAEILCVGTELLMGQVLNTNAQFLSRRLSALGITQQHQTVVGDNAQRLEDAYRIALSRADIVITSGGLGPTVDDITKRVAAKVAGKELVLFPEAEEMVRTRFQQYHRNMTLNNLSQAMFTADSTLLMNPNPARLSRWVMEKSLSTCPARPASWSRCSPHRSSRT